MWHVQRVFQGYIFVLIVAINLQQSLAESRVFNGGYGFGAPINVGGESSYGLGNYAGGSGGNSGFGLSSGLNGLHNGFGDGSSSSGLGYGLAASNYLRSYPSYQNFNSFQQNPFTQSAAGPYPTPNFGGSFYPGSGGYFGQSFGGYGLQRPLSIGSGIGNYGSQTSSGLGLSPGYPLGTGFTGLGSSFGGFNGYGGSQFGHGLGFSAHHQQFK